MSTIMWLKTENKLINLDKIIEFNIELDKGGNCYTIYANSNFAGMSDSRVRVKCFEKKADAYQYVNVILPARIEDAVKRGSVII